MKIKQQSNRNCIKCKILSIQLLETIRYSYLIDRRSFSQIFSEYLVVLAFASGEVWSLKFEILRNSDKTPLLSCIKRKPFSLSALSCITSSSENKQIVRKDETLCISIFVRSSLQCKCLLVGLWNCGSRYTIQRFISIVHSHWMQCYSWSKFSCYSCSHFPSQPQQSYTHCLHCDWWNSCRSSSHKSKWSNVSLFLCSLRHKYLINVFLCLNLSGAYSLHPDAQQEPLHKH